MATTILACFWPFSMLQSHKVNLAAQSLPMVAPLLLEESAKSHLAFSFFPIGFNLISQPAGSSSESTSPRILGSTKVVAQLIVCFPGMRKAFSLIPSTQMW